jgi:hypothetical protein
LSVSNTAVSNGHSWRWLNKRKGLPSLRNEITSYLFRANYVKSFPPFGGQQMILSEMGKVIAKKLQDT